MFGSAKNLVLIVLIAIAQTVLTVWRSRRQTAHTHTYKLNYAFIGGYRFQDRAVHHKAIGRVFNQQHHWIRQRTLNKTRTKHLRYMHY